MATYSRAIITGGAGFLGSALAKQLIGEGSSVIVMDNFSTGSYTNISRDKSAEGCRLITADVTAPWPEFDEQIDLIMHLACPASPTFYRRHRTATLATCSAGTRNALEAAHRHDARFILASTSEVYGDPHRHPQKEDYWGNANPVGDRSVYDEGKRYAEALTIAYGNEFGTDVGIARIFNTYGPGMRADDGRLIPTLICQALAGEPLTVFGDGQQTRSLCYVDDTMRGLLALAYCTESGPVNLGNPGEMTVNDIARTIVSLSGQDSRIDHWPAMPDDPRRRCPDIERARTLLNWEPIVEFGTGLRHTVDWFARWVAAI